MNVLLNVNTLPHSVVLTSSQTPLAVFQDTAYSDESNTAPFYVLHSTFFVLASRKATIYLFSKTLHAPTLIFLFAIVLNIQY